MKTINIKVQGWDVKVTDFFKEIEIKNTNIRNMETHWDKVKKYRDMLKENPEKYPYEKSN